MRKAKTTASSATPSPTTNLLKPANAATGSGTTQQVLTTKVENLHGDNTAASVADSSCNNAASQGSVSRGNDSQDQRVIKAMDATNIVGSQPWSETTTEGDGDLYVAPVYNTTNEPGTPEVKVDYNMSNDPTGKKALHKRLNKRSVNFIRKISDTESSTLNDSLQTMIVSSLKAAYPANLKDLQKIPKLSLLPVAETVDRIPNLALLPVAGSVETIPLPSLLPVAELAEENSKFPPPPQLQPLLAAKRGRTFLSTDPSLCP
jgi:hypothetical protein